MRFKESLRSALCASIVLGIGVAGLQSNALAAPAPVLLSSENSPGSFLVFPEFDIRNGTTTQLRLVNNHYRDIDVKLNYVCPGVKNVNDFCAALDNEVSLTPHQTKIIDVASAHPPCNQGYVVAYAINRYDRPVPYNHLTGSYNITVGREVLANNAIALQSGVEVMAQVPVDSLPELGSATSKFTFGPDEAYYYGIGTNLFTDFRAVNLDDAGAAVSGSKVVLLTLDVLAGMQNPPAVAFVDFWNAAEVPFSTSTEFICWTEKRLDQINVNFLEENLGTTYGSMTLQPFPNCPVPGGCPPLVPYDPSLLGTITEFGNDSALNGRLLSHDGDPKAGAYQPR